MVCEYRTITKSYRAQLRRNPRLRECYSQVGAEVVSTAGTNFTKPGACHLADPCTVTSEIFLPGAHWGAGMAFHFGDVAYEIPV